MSKIDFAKLTKETTGIAPVVDGAFQLNRKKYQLNTEDGWYRVAMKGNEAREIAAIFPGTEPLPGNRLKGYTYNNKLVFSNFDSGMRKTGAEVEVDLVLNNSPTFSSIDAVLWEDGKIYFCGMNYGDMKAMEVKNLFEEDTPGALDDVKGITPEMRTVYIFHDMQRTALKMRLEMERKEEEKRQWMQTLEGRLATTLENAGGKLLSYELTGKKAIIEWELVSTKRRYNSAIDAETFQIIEAGYCLSAEDSKHTVGSMVQLAEQYEENRETLITRAEDEDALHPIGPHF